MESIVRERKEAGSLLCAARPSWLPMQLAFGNAGILKPRVTNASSTFAEVVHKPKGQVDVVIQAWRCVVERPLARARSNRRLTKDLGASGASSGAFIHAA